MLKCSSWPGSPARPQPQLKEDKKFKEIEQARPGLDWIARILRNRYHAGYRGRSVALADKDKVLLWWHMWSPDRTFVFHGDLRHAIVSDEQATKLGIGDNEPDATTETEPSTK